MVGILSSSGSSRSCWSSGFGGCCEFDWLGGSGGPRGSCGSGYDVEPGGSCGLMGLGALMGLVGLVGLVSLGFRLAARRCSNAKSVKTEAEEQRRKGGGKIQEGQERKC